MSSPALKRKAEGSPGDQNRTLKRRRNSLPDFHTSMAKDTLSVVEQMSLSLKDPEIVNSIASALQPNLSEAISKEVKEVTDHLQKTFINLLVESQTKITASVKEALIIKDNQIAALESKLNDPEQYGGRNSIRLSSISIDKFPSGSNPNFNSYVVELINDKVKPAVSVTEDNIARSHPIG